MKPLCRFRMRPTRIAATALIGTVIGVFAYGTAFDMPMFTRKYDLECGSCHTNFDVQLFLTQILHENGGAGATRADRHQSGPANQGLQLAAGPGRG